MPKRYSLKPKLALYWAASCGGCDEALVDLNEELLAVTQAFEIVFWPCAMDFKYEDLSAYADQEIFISLINGAVRNSEQEEIVNLLRKKSQVVVALGACACGGGIPALANLKTREAILERVYKDADQKDNPEPIIPGNHPENSGDLPRLLDFYPTVFKLADKIAVDYYLPGCPPTHNLISQALRALMTDPLPAGGGTLAPESSQCKTCRLNASKPDRIVLPELKRVHTLAVDPQLCFLAQGILCMGPATRDGCLHPCIEGQMPCTGCLGPLTDLDQGAKMIASLGGLHGSAIAAQTLTITDPAGSFYRYSLAASLLGSQREKDKNHEP
jgi:F420-non-reducing hydrogenase small subunit